MEQQLDIFYNTVNIKGSPLRAIKNKIRGQNKIIYDYFKSHPHDLLTPCQVHMLVFQEVIPITSVRRAMNTLTKMGKLAKTSAKKLGKYGVVNYCWRLNSNHNENIALI